jgi:hypothetical protein
MIAAKEISRVELGLELRRPRPTTPPKPLFDQQAEAKNNVRVINVAPGFVKTDIHEGMGISFEEYCRLTGKQEHQSPKDYHAIRSSANRCRRRRCGAGGGSS